MASDAPPARQAGSYLRSLSTVVSSPGAVETVANPYANPLLPAMLQAQLTTLLAGPAARWWRGPRRVSARSRRATSRGPPTASSPTTHSRWLAGMGTEHRARRRGHGRSILGARLPRPGAHRADADGRGHPHDGAARPRHPGVVRAGGPARRPGPRGADRARRAGRDLEAGAGARREPIVRGIAIAPPPTLPVEMWDPLLQRVSRGAVPRAGHRRRDSWIASTPRTRTPTASSPRPRAPRSIPRMQHEIDELSHNVEAYGSMLGPASEAPTELRRKLFTATAPAVRRRTRPRASRGSHPSMRRPSRRSPPPRRS